MQRAQIQRLICCPGWEGNGTWSLLPWLRYGNRQHADTCQSSCCCISCRSPPNSLFQMGSLQQASNRPLHLGCLQETPNRPVHLGCLQQAPNRLVYLGCLQYAPGQQTGLSGLSAASPQMSIPTGAVCNRDRHSIPWVDWVRLWLAARN